MAKKKKTLLEEVSEQDRVVTDKDLLELDADDRVRVLRKTVSRLRKKLAERESGRDLLQSVFQDIYDEPFEIEVPRPPKPKKKTRQESAVLHLTDIHFGKVTSSFDFDTARERLLELCRKVSVITELRRNTATIEQIHVCIGGDAVEGEGAVFPSQAHEVDSDLMEQAIKRGPQVLAEVLLFLLGQYPKMEVLAVPGNHGRTSKHAAKRNNADNMLYTVLQMAMRLAPRSDAISWNLPLDRESGDEWWAHTVVCDRWGLLLVHGDQIRGQLGFPWYGTGKKVAGWIDTVPYPWDYLLMGHFHTQATFDINARTVLATGSIESHNAYAAENMAAGGAAAKQRLCFFDSEHGLIADYPVYLSERQPNR